MIFKRKVGKNHNNSSKMYGRSRPYRPSCALNNQTGYEHITQGNPSYNLCHFHFSGIIAGLTQNANGA
jgi:hypothetical protein